ncbi:MAG: redoxin domain-containing protein [Pseudohongiellaceae bacterium]
MYRFISQILSRSSGRAGWHLLAALMVIPAALAHGQERAGNFTLIDHQGKAVELYYHDYANAVVLMGHRAGENAVTEAIRSLEAATGEYSGVEVFLINAVEGQDRDVLRADAERNEVTFPVLNDRSRLVAESLGLEYPGQALVLDTHRWDVIYRGPVTDGETTLLADALASHLAEQSVSRASVDMPEAFRALAFDLPDAAEREAHEQISYSETIAPMLQEKCADCHRPGGIGPWAMTGHAMVQGFSPMIRETVLTKRMPPWHADPEVGEFRHDLSLSDEQARTLVHWIDAGAPRGDGPDPLAEHEWDDTQWERGEPDLVVDLPAFEVPATGVLDYQYFEVKNPLDRDVWVEAVQIVPGDRQVVHHAISTFGESSSLAQDSDSGEALLQPQLMTFVPGNETYIYPEGNGVYVPADSSFYTQMHYTTYGKATTDQTKIGLYFADEAPEHVLQHYAILDTNLDIPAGDPEHTESAYYEFRRDAVIYSLFPHAHYRGRSSSFSLQYPDGREELVLSVPNYDFNWQRYFQFQEPIEVPAGTKVIHRTAYDNSPNNETNPDPEVDVRFGEQTWQEMLYGGISFRYAESRPDDHEIDKSAYLTSLAMGFMDENMDGKVALDEMPERSRESLALPFTMLDKNKSGGLEFEQFQQLMASDGMSPNEALSGQ